ncbi:MAG: amidohydrolase family protein, partial [Candidatus Hydrogenedentes bacterium]|nr:amidohydrolase family protein [Candidatus Hydrogenedentota bacterium]
GILKWQKKIAKEHAHRLFPLCSVHPHDRNPENWIRRIAEEGIGGVKLHPMYQDFSIDDERLWCIYEAIAEHDLLLEMHCGRDIGFPNDPVPDRASPQRVAAILRRFSGLKMLCTHMGGWQMWDQVETHLLGKDVYLGTSFALNHMTPERFRKMVQVHGAEKICFGSDWPWNDQDSELGRIEQSGLGKNTIRQLRTANAAQLLGL